MFVPADAKKLNVTVPEFILTSKRLYMSSYRDHILRKAIEAYWFMRRRFLNKPGV